MEHAASVLWHSQIWVLALGRLAQVLPCRDCNFNRLRNSAFVKPSTAIPDVQCCPTCPECLERHMPNSLDTLSKHLTNRQVQVLRHPTLGQSVTRLPHHEPCWSGSEVPRRLTGFGLFESVPMRVSFGVDEGCWHVTIPSHKWVVSASELQPRHEESQVVNLAIEA